MSEAGTFPESRGRGVASYLRLGLLGLSVVAILTLFLALFSFWRLTGNLSEISQETLPVLELARELTHQTKSIESNARRLANLRQPFQLQSLSSDIADGLDRLSETIAKLDTTAIAGERLRRMNELIGEIRAAVERLDVLARLAMRGEARYRGYGDALARLAETATHLDAVLDEHPNLSPDQRRAVIEKLYGALEHAFVSLSTTAPRDVVPSKVAFLLAASEFEILLRDLELPRTSPVWEIPALLGGVTGMFDDRLDLMRAELRVQGAVSRLVIIENLIHLSLDVSRKLTEQAETQAVAMEQQALHLTRVIGVAVVVLLVLAIAFNLFINRRMVRRMKRLQRTMLARVDGSETAIDTTGSDEITDMARSFAYFVDEVKSRERSLRDAYDVISDSIKYASRIQRSVLSDTALLDQRFSDHFVLWEPRDVVGGDIYWCESWGDGILIILADCTGHGVPGAFVTLLATGALERAKLDVEHGDLAGLVQRIHQYVQTTLGQHLPSGESDDGLELGACFVAKGSRDLEFVGARFDLFVGTADGVDVVRGTKKGIGYRAIPIDQAYDTRTIPMSEGMALYMISDGIIDQVGGERRRGFGKRRLAALLQEMRGHTGERQRSRLREALVTYQGAESRRDDVSAIGLIC